MSHSFYCVIGWCEVLLVLWGPAKYVRSVVAVLCWWIRSKECILMKIYLKLKSYCSSKCIYKCHLQSDGHLFRPIHINILMHFNRRLIRYSIRTPYFVNNLFFIIQIQCSAFVGRWLDIYNNCKYLASDMHTLSQHMQWSDAALSSIDIVIDKWREYMTWCQWQALGQAYWRDICNNITASLTCPVVPELR